MRRGKELRGVTASGGLRDSSLKNPFFAGAQTIRRVDFFVVRGMSAPQEQAASGGLRDSSLKNPLFAGASALRRV